MREGDKVALRALAGATNANHDAIAKIYPAPFDPLNNAAAHAMSSLQVVQVADTEAPDAPEVSKATGRAVGFRSIAVAPLLRGREGIGAIAINGPRANLLSEKQIALLKTFADQAVIAIENTRLFEAEQASKRELQESLEHQTATSDVLGVIAASPTNIQPVLQTLVESSCRLCGAYDGIILLRDGDWLQVKAHHGPIPTNPDKRKITRDWVNGRCVTDGVQIHLRDLQAESTEYPEGAALAQRLGARTILSTPLVREGEAIGAIMMRRDEVRPFSDKQIALVETFAAQAVIAIENTRLFEAEQASKHELQESLEYQTATADVLEVISTSPNDVKPVLKAIALTSGRLCQAEDAHIFLLSDGEYRLVAVNNPDKEWVQVLSDNPLTAETRGSVTARAIREKRVLHIEDTQADPEHAEGLLSRQPRRTVISVPLLREKEVIGAITLNRRTVNPFTPRQTALLETFADQAVIAIENTRLFEEVQRRTADLEASLQQQVATADVLKVISRSAFNLQLVLDALVESAAKLCSGDDVSIFQLEAANLIRVAHYGSLRSPPAQVVPAVHGTTAGRSLLERRPIHVADLQTETEEYPEGSKLARELGHRTILVVPLLREGDPLGVMALRRNNILPFSDKQVDLVQTFADQAVIAIENTRLLEQLQTRTRELAKTIEDLEIASQHKSQFVANMSHELRTPLAAILGYAELMQEGFYEAQGPKSMDALTRIRSNGKHLLGLINTVLDIAKIESGQFTLNMAEYDVQSIVETVRSATESLAQNKKLTLKTDVAKSLPFGLGDEQRLTQVLLNLVGNAIKFTDTGEVQVSAAVANGAFTVSVADSGPGIPPDQLTRVFEQFHQVDSSNTKAKGGTGLGLAISKQIVEMHGGRIWVESELGKGSVFHMELPTRAEFRKAAP
jgi:signal transduction histidine kinase